MNVDLQGNWGSISVLQEGYSLSNREHVKSLKHSVNKAEETAHSDLIIVFKGFLWW